MVDVFDRHEVRFDPRLAGCSKFVRYSDFADLAAENERLKQRLADYQRDTSTVDAHETANVRGKPAAPEAQQESVEMEAMVQAAWFAYWSKELKGLDEGDMNRMRAALKAAMEAGRHE